MRISVLIPCFNGAAYLAEALDSVMLQGRAAEVILVDDGSTDGTEAITKRFAGVRYDRQPHQGIAAARNRALALAQGDAVAFLDADDLWPKNSLAARADLLDASPGAAWAGGLVQEFLSPELDVSVQRGLAVQPEPMPGRLMSALLVRRETFARVGDFDLRYAVGESLDWVARADSMGLQPVSVGEIVLRRRIHLTNTGHRVRGPENYLQLLRASIDRRRHMTGQPGVSGQA